MTYESVAEIESRVAPGVRFTIAKMSFGRRTELMRRVRELAQRIEFLEAGKSTDERMEGGLLRAEIDRLYLTWGLRSVEGLVVDGVEATPEVLVERGPEALCREALEAVRSETGLSESERKN